MAHHTTPDNHNPAARLARDAALDKALSTPTPATRRRVSATLKTARRLNPDRARREYRRAHIGALDAVAARIELDL